MGNCGLKPATNEAEAPAPEQKAEEVVVESREIVVGEEVETKVIDGEVAKLSISDSPTQPPSLGQLILETEGKTTEEAIPTPSEPVKETIVETTVVAEVTPVKTEEAEPKKEAEPVVAEEEKKKPEEEKK